jgi:microcystin-dependent protein
MATITVTPTQTFVSGNTVTPATLNQLAQSTVALTAGTVAVADLATATVERLLPAGAVMPFAMNSAPSGWLAADGTAVSRSAYATLFAAISTTHGVGDGSTTFNLPDLRGIFVRGSGSQDISGITYNKTFAAKEGDAFQGHQHAVTHNAVYAVAGNAYQGGNGAILNAATIQVGNPTTDGANGTPRTAVETRPANIALLYCIKF